MYKTIHHEKRQISPTELPNHILLIKVLTKFYYCIPMLESYQYA